MALRLETPRWVVDQSRRRLEDMLGLNWRNVRVSPRRYRCGCPCGCAATFGGRPRRGMPAPAGFVWYGDAIICQACADRNQAARACAWVGL